MLKFCRKAYLDESPHDFQENFSDLDDPSDLQIINLPPEGTGGGGWHSLLGGAQKPPRRKKGWQAYASSDDKLDSNTANGERYQDQLHRCWSSGPCAVDRVTVSPSVPRRRNCDLERVHGRHALPTHSPFELDVCDDDEADADDLKDIRLVATISDPSVVASRSDASLKTFSCQHQHNNQKVRSTFIKNKKCAITWKIRDAFAENSIPDECQDQDEDKNSERKTKVASTKIKNESSKFKRSICDSIKPDTCGSVGTVVPLSAVPATLRLPEAVYSNTTAPSNFDDVRQGIVRQICSGSDVEQRSRPSGTRIGLRNASETFRWKVLDVCSSIKKLTHFSSKPKTGKKNRVFPK